MNDYPIRKELFAALEVLSERIPDMRAGQLMAALGEVCADIHGRGLWEAEDAEVLEAVWKFRNEFEASAAAANGQLAAS